MEYRIIRSSRTTISLQVRADGITVRAPFGVSDECIRDFVREHADWIRKTEAKVAEEIKNRPKVVPLSADELHALAEQAREVIVERVKYYAPLVGVSYGKITIRNQKTRWGSCSSKGNLNFNCLLMLAPPEVVDSVVVHELCHLKEMNHSEAFYAEVLRVYPDYYKWDKWLKDNGAALIRRMTG